MHMANLEYLKTHLAKQEYIEGPQATANFERLAKAVFRAKKRVVSPSAAPKAKTSRKSGKGQA
jgi:hypothetical protein